MPSMGLGGGMPTSIAAPKGIGSKGLVILNIALSKIANKAVAKNLNKARVANEGITINVPSYGTVGMGGGYGVCILTKIF